MLAGRRAFAGESFADVVGAVMKSEPNWTALPGATPTLVRSVMRRCLQKDPARRLRDIADARLELQEAMVEPAAAAGATAGPDRSGPALSVDCRGRVRGGRCRRIRSARSHRTAYAPPHTIGLSAAGRRGALCQTLPPGLSADGRDLLSSGIGAGTRQLYVRRLDEFEPLRFAGPPARRSRSSHRMAVRLPSSRRTGP